MNSNRSVAGPGAGIWPAERHDARRNPRRSDEASARQGPRRESPLPGKWPWRRVVGGSRRPSVLLSRVVPKPCARPGLAVAAATPLQSGRAGTPVDAGRSAPGRIRREPGDGEGGEAPYCRHFLRTTNAPPRTPDRVRVMIQARERGRRRCSPRRSSRRKRRLPQPMTSPSNSSARVSPLTQVLASGA
jgi:hypothetical protein